MEDSKLFIEKFRQQRLWNINKMLLLLQQGLEIRGFWFQKKTVQLKTALREVYISLSSLLRFFFFSFFFFLRSSASLSFSCFLCFFSFLFSLSSESFRLLPGSFPIFKRRKHSNLVKLFLKKHKGTKSSEVIWCHGFQIVA